MDKMVTKMAKMGGKMCTGYIMAVGEVHPEGEFRPLLFSHSWTTRRPESTCWSGNCRCLTEIWLKMYITYVRF